MMRLAIRGLFIALWLFLAESVTQDQLPPPLSPPKCAMMLLEGRDSLLARRSPNLTNARSTPITTTTAAAAATIPCRLSLPRRVRGNTLPRQRGHDR